MSLPHNRSKLTEATNKGKEQSVESLPFDEKDFDDTGVELPERLRTPKSLLARLRQAAIEYGNEPEVEPSSTQGRLFGDPVPASRDQSPVTQEPNRSQHLWSIVVRAYADVRSERSIDYVVADPEANLLFLQRCWELGAPASPFELNWMLMNARKDGKLTTMPRAKRFSIPKDQLDHFSFAADVAMRAVQERIYYSEQRNISIDHVLCDPHLSREFDNYAKQVIPGQSTLEYRWTIMALRKARRSCDRSYRLPTFHSFGLLEDLRVQNLPRVNGTYWIVADEGSLFTGVAGNLQLQIDNLVQRIGTGGLPPWVADRPREKPRVMVCEAESFDAGEIIRAGIFRERGSRLNFWNGSFFGEAAA